GRRGGVGGGGVRSDLDWGAVGARSQRGAGREGIARLPPQAQIVAFFEWWTRSEAYVKACGEGLGAGEARLGAEPDPGWSIVALDAGPGFAAALAVDGRDVQIVECDAWLAACR